MAAAKHDVGVQLDRPGIRPSKPNVPRPAVCVQGQRPCGWGTVGPALDSRAGPVGGGVSPHCSPERLRQSVSPSPTRTRAPKLRAGFTSVHEFRHHRAHRPPPTRQQAVVRDRGPQPVDQRQYFPMGLMSAGSTAPSLGGSGPPLRCAMPAARTLGLTCRQQNGHAIQNEGRRELGWGPQLPSRSSRTASLSTCPRRGGSARPWGGRHRQGPADPGRNPSLAPLYRRLPPKVMPVSPFTAMCWKGVAQFKPSVQKPRALGFAAQHGKLPELPPDPSTKFSSGKASPILAMRSGAVACLAAHKAATAAAH